jgi:RNA polymerase sigma factor (sigma-70 family)
MDEKQLLKDCLKGDEIAQKHFYEQYAPKMFGVCLRYAKDKSTAEDYLQEAFVKVFTKLKSYRSEGSLEGWIRRVVVNCCLEQLRKSDILKYSVELNYAHQITDADANISEQIHATQLLEHIRSLPPGFRTVFNLFAIEGYSHKEIAKLLQISEGTSKSQYARARVWLQHKLEKESSIENDRT